MKKLAILSLLVFVQLSTFSQTNRLSEQIGNVKNQKVVGGKIDGTPGYVFELDNAYAQILFYNSTTVRVRVTKEKPQGDHSYAIDSLQSNGPEKIGEDEYRNQSIFTTNDVKVVVDHKPFRISFYNKEGVLLNADDASLGISWYGNQVSNYKKLHKDEKFIGLGEKTGGINRRGQFYQHWNSDVPGYALNADPLYSTIPFFIGIHDKVAYGIFFDNSHKTYFNFGGGADEDIFHFGAEDGEMNYYFFGSGSVENIIKDYTALTGRTPMPPLWSLGFQQSRWGYDSQEQLLDIAKTFRNLKMPADVIVSDIPYMDNYKIFTWSNKFPNVKGMMKEMKEMGFDMVTIIDPGIKVEKGYESYEQGLKGNHFAKYPDGRNYIGHVWPGRCHFPDFTKSSTQKWWGQSFKEPYVNNGIRGFWNDMNEPAAWGREFPNVIEFGEGKEKATLFKVKNAYGSLMSKATYEGTKALMNGQRPFVLTRAAYAGIQKYSAQWTGDNVSSDEHMLLGFRLLNSMGVSGVPFTGMDIGGFMGNPSPELFTRWMSLGIYSPLFRNHTHIGYNYREPWQFGENYTVALRKILEQRYQLLPYLYSAFYEASQTGMPVNRMLPINYTFDNNVYNGKFENQFLFGNQMLVCPVESNKQTVEVYLPGSGNWYRYNSTWNRNGNDEVFKGGKSYYVPSPINDLPVFVKEGAIIPMQSIIQNTKEIGDGILYVHIWKGEGMNTFTYYEDDGETYDHEKGEFYKRDITFKRKEREIIFSEVEGNYRSKFKKIKLVLHGFGTEMAVFLNGKMWSAHHVALSGVEFENDSKQMRLTWE